MDIHSIRLGPLQTNCYVLSDANGTGAVIDPGLYTPQLEHLLFSHVRKLELILLTHGHGDHISGVLPLREKTGASVCIHRLDDAFTDSALNMAADCGCPFLPFKADRLLEDGDTVSFGQETMSVLHTPGHTPGGVCYLHEKDRVLFSGDTLFCLTAGRTDFPRGSLDDLMDSLARLRDLDGNYTVYPGHERATTLDAERKRNLYMRRLKK